MTQSNIEIHGYLLDEKLMTSKQKDLFIQAIEHSGMAAHLTGNANYYQGGSLIITRSTTLMDEGYIGLNDSRTYDFAGFIEYVVSLPELSSLDFHGYFEVTTYLNDRSLASTKYVNIKDGTVKTTGNN